MVAVPTLRPWTNTVPTFVAAALENVTAVLPALVATVDRVTTAGSLLVAVTLTGLGGALASVIVLLTCNSRPTVTSANVIAGAVTVAVIWRRLFGVENPAGGTTVMTAVPAD